MAPAVASAQYTQRANQTISGGITFTGNTLGLDGDSNRNGQGTRGGIATFTTTDITQRDLLPDSGSAPPFPFGTTNDWRLNSSAAQLRLPSGARVVHAELVWGGTYGDRDENVHAFIEDPVLFTAPGAGAVQVAPVGGKTDGSDNSGCETDCFYARTADVTALVLAGGAGTYTVGRVPATQGTNDNNAPVAGWTLAVLYEDFTQPIRNLTLFLGLEPSGGAAAEVSGFCTPPLGALSARLAVSSIEGDARITGDKLLFGPTSSLNDGDRVAGPRNPISNFFSGQIADDAGNLDTSGTFGDRNHSPGDPQAGARQGWDITNVDASARMQNNQTSAFARGATDGDVFRIMALALQIDVGAPRFFNTAAKQVDRATAQVGDIITYTVHVDNTLGTADANNVVFFDPPPAGTSFVAGSVTVGGVAQPGADPVAGVALGTIAQGASVDVTLQVQIVAAGSNIRSNRANWTFDFVSCAGQAPLPGSAQSNTVTTEVPIADLSIAKTFLTTPAVAGAPVSYQIVVQNAGPSTSTGMTISDPATTPALTGVTWTCTPQSAGSSCGAASGSGALSTTATLPPNGGVVYTVTGTLPANTPAGTISNTATVAASALVPDPAPGNNTAIATAPIVTRADVRVTKSGPATAQRGDTLTYSIVVTNNGPSDATDVLVTDPAPTDLAAPVLTGPCTVAPGCALAAGASQTISAQVTIPPGYPVTSPDPIVNLASVTSATTDLNPLNNSGRANTALDAPVADLSITKTNNTTTVTPGLTATYTITVTNLGPATAPGAHVVDTFDPAIFSAVTWTCAPSGTSTCTASGPQIGNIDTLVTVVPGAGNAIVFTAQATLLTTAIGQVENTVTVSTAPGESDPDESNNSATDTDTAEPIVDVSILKTGPATIIAGTSATYTIVVTNDGPSTARLIPVSDRVLDITGPERSDLISGFTAPAGVPCTTRPFLDVLTAREIQLQFCDILSLAPAETATFTVTLTIPPDFPAGTLDNIAFVDSPAFHGNDVDIDDHVSSVFVTIAPQADVAVTKLGPETAVAGSTVSYFLQVTNNGPSTATNVVLTDPLPAGLVVAGADGPCASLPCTIPSLAPGAGSSTRFDILIPADYAGPPSFVNTATVQSSTPDSNASNNTASLTTLVVSEQADVLVQKSGPSVVAPGGQIEYVARVVNLGPGPARDVVWADAIPGGTTLVGGTPPAAPTTCTVPPAGTSNLVTCRTPLLDVGQSLEFRFTVQASADLVPGSVITNVASVSSPTPDLNPANNRAELVTTVAAATEADVQVEKSDLPDPVVSGSDVTYTIVVRNLGPAPATSVMLTDTLPAGMTLVSVTPSQGSCPDTTCALGSLAPGATATVTLIATSSATGRFENVASVSAAETDPVSSNNTATQPTTVANADGADLVIQKVGPTVLAPGVTSVYTLLVTNRGPATALAIDVADPLPTGMTFVANSGGCITAFPCEIEQLGPGESRLIRTTIAVDPAAPVPALLTNTASVASSVTADPDPANNSSSVSTSLFDPSNADLALTKRDSPDPVVGGTQIAYVLIVENRGPAEAAAVVVTDTVPMGVTVLSATSTQGTCTGTSSIVCTVGNLAAGSRAQIEMLGTAPPDVPAPNPMINTATAESASPDPDPANNTASAPTTVITRSDVRVVKTGPPAIVPGANAVYSVTVSNAGPSTASGVALADPAPTGLSLVGVSGACSALPCVLGSIAVGDSRSVEIVFAVPPTYQAPNPVVNVATVVSTSLDPGLANNVASVSTPVGPATADLSVTKIGPSRVTTGRTAVYTIAVTNAGPSAASAVTLDDPAPPGLSVMSVTGDCTSLPCALGTLAPGEARSVTVTFSVPAAYAGPRPIVNRASVSSSTADPLLGNNVAMATTAVASGSLCNITGTGIPEFVTGAGPGGGPHVRVWSIAASQLSELGSGFFTYSPYFPGGVNVACADVSGDGIADIITGVGPGGGPHVRVWSAVGNHLTEFGNNGFFAYSPYFPGGVNVAAGDVDGDGVAEIVTGAGPGGGPHVRFWQFGPGEWEEIWGQGFYAYSPYFPGGVNVAVGDVNGDGVADVITGAGPGGGPHVRVWNFVNNEFVELGHNGFFAYSPYFPGGVNVAAGDVDGDGIAEIITGAGPGGGPHVRVWKLIDETFVERTGIMAYNPYFPGGVHVGAADVDGDGIAEILTGAGPGDSPHVRIWKLSGVTLVEVFGFFAYHPAFAGGVFVGK